MNYDKEKEITIEAVIEYDYNCDEIKEIIGQLLKLKGLKELKVKNDD